MYLKILLINIYVIKCDFEEIIYKKGDLMNEKK